MKKLFTAPFILSLLLTVLAVLPSQAQIWSEDFSNGLTGWTQVDLSTNQSGDAWIHSTTGPQGSFQIAPIASASAANGYALFDSDLLCSHSQNAVLISPSINCASEPNVFLFFSQQYRRYLDQTFVQVSVDGGTTWAGYEVNAGLADNDFSSSNPEEIEIDISDVAGNQAAVLIAFQFVSDDQTDPTNTGCGYSWMVDDIHLETEGSNPVSTIIWGGPDDPIGSMSQSSLTGNANTGWTNSTLSTDQDAQWLWDAEGDASEGAYWGTRQPIISASIANGAMVFNSDFYDNAGTPGNFGNGIAAAPQQAELISPIIDLTAHPFVSLQFNQYYRNFQSTTSVAFSTDGGASWSDPIVVNESLATNAQTARDNVQKVPLIGAGGASQFRFKFIFDANYYFWIIDDAAIVAREEYELKLGDFFYPPASFEQPVTQIDIDTMGFSVDVSNIGSKAQTDVSLTAKVYDSDDNEIFSTELIIPEIAAETVDSTFSLPDQFVPNDLDVDEYRIEYTISSANPDGDDSDNRQNELFRVTNSLFSKENNAAATEAAFRPGGGGDYFVGNFYRTSPNWATDQYRVNEVSFRLEVNSDDPLPDKKATIILAEVKDDVDANFDNFEDTQLNPLLHPQLIAVGYKIHTFTTEASGDLVTVQMTDINGDPGVVLSPGKRYFLLFGYSGASNTVFHSFNNEIEYFQISTLVVSSSWFLGGFGPENAAVGRMNLELVNKTDETPLPDESLTFYPNPVNDLLNVEISLKNQGLANLVIADMNGKIIRIDEIQNAKLEQRQIKTHNLPSGTYLLRLATAEGTKTKQFVVQH